MTDLGLEGALELWGAAGALDQKSFEEEVVSFGSRKAPASAIRPSTGSAASATLAVLRCTPRNPQCPLHVDSRRRLKRLKCANSGHWPTERQPFKSIRSDRAGIQRDPL